MIVALLAGLHYLGLGIGLGSVFMRGRYFAALKRVSAVERPEVLRHLFMADNLWGAAAFIWVGSGLVRAFGGMEKGTAFYMGHHLFLLKMALVLLVFALEIVPMVTLIKWRVASAKGKVPNGVADNAFLHKLCTINSVQIGLVVVLPLVAAMMARGLFYHF